MFSLLDWIAKKNDVRFNAWRVLTKPVDPSDQKRRGEQLKLVNILEDLVTKRAARDALSKHLQWALGIDSEVVETILWDPPRPLLTAVVPTALRRLRSNWGTVSLGERSDVTGGGPLPEFVVSALFSDLELPEITAVTEDGEEHPMAALQALRAFAPGRASHRLTVRRRSDRFWIEPPGLHGRTER